MKEEQVSQLSNEIADSTNALTQNEALIQSQEKAREQEKRDHAAALRDFEESVSALSRAISVLKERSQDVPQSSEALLQVVGDARLPSAAKELIASFVGFDGTDGSYAPEANAYEFQSGSIVEILQKLRVDFENKAHQLQIEESNSAHAAAMVVQDLRDTIKHGKTRISSATEQKASLVGEVAVERKEKTMVEKSLEVDQQTLASTTAQCDQKKLSFDEKQKNRQDEITALEQAMQILKSDGVQQVSAGTSGSVLAQLLRRGAGLAETDIVRHKVVQFVESEAKRLHSKDLGLLVEKLVTDPFVKVKKLIQSMIDRLMAEASADTELKGYCDRELGVSQINLDSMAQTMQRLHTSIDEAEAEKQERTIRKADLATEVVQAREAMATATAERKEEKASNQRTVAEAKAAQEQITQAIKILTDYYNKSGGFTALLQKSRNSRQPQGPAIGTEEWNELATEKEGSVDRGHKEGMQMFGDRFTGQQEKAGGVLALLEVIMGDFANLEAETEAAEASSAKQFDETMGKLETTLAVGTQELEQIDTRLANLGQKLTSDAADLHTEERKHGAATRYRASLDAKCSPSGVTVKTRSEQRAAEIQSLKEVLAILSE
uniref:Uncharacterized protein n=1 Tax=Noctiluca scintillans TaxID=2966 RepID=A0A7S1FD45_NOCSC